MVPASYFDTVKHTKYLTASRYSVALKTIKFLVIPEILSLYKLFAVTIFFNAVKVRTVIFAGMEVNIDLVNNIAHLARLYFTEEEKQELIHDLQRMISFVEKLNEVNTEGVQPLQHMSSEINVLREDKIEGSMTRDEALKNAPLTDEIFFKVPKVIKK